jgi:hypothetical protein
LKREPKTNYVWFEPGSEIRATHITATGESFSTTSVDAMTKDEIMGSRYIYALNLDSIIGASAVLAKAPAKAPEAAKQPEAAPAKKDENEEDIIKKLKRTQLLPDPLEELHPAYCARRTT